MTLECAKVYVIIHIMSYCITLPCLLTRNVLCTIHKVVSQLKHEWTSQTGYRATQRRHDKESERRLRSTPAESNARLHEVHTLLSKPYRTQNSRPPLSQSSHHDVHRALIVRRA